MIRKFIPHVLLLAICAAILSQTGSAQAQRWEREFESSVSVIVLHNPVGRTEVEVVAASTIHVLAEAATSEPLDESAIQIDQSAPGVMILKIAPATNANLRVSVPSRAIISVVTDTGKITVRGVAASLSAESRSGNIILHLPANLDADFSFKTGTGQVLAGITLAETAGHSGPKGRPVLHARSESGNIVLLPLTGDAASLLLPDAARGVPLTPDQQRIASIRQRIAARTGSAEPPPKSLASWRAGDRKRAAPADGRVRVNSDLVLVNAYVVDPNNSSVADLHKEDFAVLDNKTQQQVAIFEPVHRPLDLFILLDLSGSTHSKFDVVKKAVKKFVDTLAPEDRIAIGAFTSRFIVISDFTNDRKLLKKRMDDTKNRRGGTEFYRSMWNTLDLLAEVDSPRRAIVVMTDGVDNSLQAGVRTNVTVTFEELLERIRNDGISIYPIYLNTEYQMVVKEGSGDSLSYKEAREQLQAIADATGTTMFRADRFEDLAGAYERVAAELRNLYTLGFYPTDRGKEGDWHDLTVRVHRADATVRARKGYFVR